MRILFEGEPLAEGEIQLDEIPVQLVGTKDEERSVTLDTLTDMLKACRNRTALK